MHKLYSLFGIILLVSAGLISSAQNENNTDTTNDNVLFERQWTLGLHLNTNGWGLKFRKGKNLSFLTQRMWEIEFSTYKALKEIKITNLYYSDSKSYVYGKLNYVYFLRGGMGIQHIMNRKPYWGGIQLSYLYYGGITIGLAKPVYLYIVSDNTRIERRYDPATDFPETIYGRGPFLDGIIYTKFYPGIYARGGLEFEFGTLNKRIQSLEIGGVLDYEPVGIPLMAYNPSQNFFLTLYLSVSMGKRYNK
jgi:TM2 domain-containing membrane protein YozV